MFVGILILFTDTDNSKSFLSTTIFCLELKERCSIFNISRSVRMGFFGHVLFNKTVHSSGYRKFLAVDKCVIQNRVGNSHVALWPAAH